MNPLSENTFNELTKGMTEAELNRIRFLGRCLSDSQLVALAKCAREEKIIPYTGAERPSFDTLEEIECEYLVKKKRVPAWLQPELAATFHALQTSAKDSAIQDVEKRKLKMLLGIQWNPLPVSFDRDRFLKGCNAKIYGKGSVFEPIADYMVARQYSNDGNIIVYIVVGPCGVGKTQSAITIAENLGCPWDIIYMEGIKEPERIIGSPNHFANSQPSIYLQKIFNIGTTQAVMIWNEFDKVFRDQTNGGGGVQECLTEFFENGWFSDQFIGHPVDCRKSIHILTCNELQDIPAVIRDRAVIVQFDDYSINEKQRIAKDYLWPELQRKFGQEHLEISKPAIDYIVDVYADSCGMRDIRKGVESMMTLALNRLHSGRPMERIELAHAKERIKPLMPRQRVSEKPEIGCATALAVTSEFAGRVMQIQTVIDEQGPERLRITGLPSDDSIMESAKIALYLAAKEANKSDACDVRIHIGDSSIHKGGPSAGLPLYMALWSAFTQTAISPQITATGEVDLWGHVKTVGGLHAKLYAAERAGCKIAFIPFVCSVQVPADLTTLQVIPISHVSEITEFILKHEQTLLKRCG